MILKLLLSGLQLPALLLLQQATGIIGRILKEPQPLPFFLVFPLLDVLCPTQGCEPASDLAPECFQTFLLTAICLSPGPIKEPPLSHELTNLLGVLLPPNYLPKPLFILSVNNAAKEV